MGLEEGEAKVELKHNAAWEFKIQVKFYSRTFRPKTWNLKVVPLPAQVENYSWVLSLF